jgi:hypothetical protein
MTRATRLLAVLLVYAMAAACGDNPNAPSKVSYAGIWNGTYNVTACTPTGDFVGADPCTALGTLGAFQLNLTQAKTTVTGSFSLGAIAFQVPGSGVANDGSLTLVGTTNFSGILITCTFNLTEPTSTTLAGSIGQLWTSPGVNGQLTVNGTLNTTTKQ